MDISRITYSFDLPDGFEILGPADHQAVRAKRLPDSVTIIRSDSRIAKEPLISENLSALRPDAFPESIVLYACAAGNFTCPMDYVTIRKTVLEQTVGEYRMIFAEEDAVGEYPAVRAQFSMQTNFRIDELLMVWIAGNVMASAGMLASPTRASDGWKILRRFANHIQFHTCEADDDHM